MIVRHCGWFLAVGIALAWLCCGQPELLAQESAATDEEAIHDQLRALREEAVDAYLKKDIDRLLACLTPDVVVILQNAEVCRGHEAVRDFHKRMSEGDDRSVKSHTTDFQVDEKSILYGENGAVAQGTINDHFVLANGMDFDLTSKWTATLVNENDRWRVASFQATANMFDNGVSNMMLKWNSVKMGGVGFAMGVIIAIAAFRLRRGKGPTA